MTLLLAAVSMSLLDWVVLLAYFVVIVAAGMWFGQFTRNTGDFFFAGRRFTWWLIAVSCVATLVGSYSFVQYAQTGFQFGFCSLMPYMNEWFVLPLFLLAWLPIVYYHRVQSIPEYFEKRFDRRTRIVVMILMLIYLEGYVAFNLLTIGVFLNGLFGWSVFWSAAAVAFLSGLYLHAGGQTSVLMTDLLQGALLLVVGLTLFALGLAACGGWSSFVTSLPPAHRLPFAGFNDPPALHAVGDFWNDAMVGTFAFYFINQGVLMRFLSARSVRDGRRAMLVVVAVMMPLAAVAVSNAGWVGRALAEQGQLTETAAGAETLAELGQNIFVVVADFLCAPGMFGLVIAAVVAALMSTLDTLITAVSAVAVNDIGRLYWPDRSEEEYLRMARRAAILATLVGLLLLPTFGQASSLYAALSRFTGIVTPPLVVVIVLGSIWPRFSARAAYGTLMFGAAMIVASLVFPQLIQPLAHGVRPDDHFIYMRSLYGLVVSLVPAVAIPCWEMWRGVSERGRFVMQDLDEAIVQYKGGQPNYGGSGRSPVLPLAVSDEPGKHVSLPEELMLEMDIATGDLVHVADARWWLGGFRSITLPVQAAGSARRCATLTASAVEEAHLLAERPVRVEFIL